jgi:putative hydrolase of the HAD superfamily
MAVAAVIFDWGGTLTPWHTIDVRQLWGSVCGAHLPAGEAAAAADRLHAAEAKLWAAAATEHRSASMTELFELAGVSATAELLASYVAAWEPHTWTDPHVPELLRGLRQQGIATGVLSNTMWPRSWHEDVFRRDGVLELFDGAVYTSEIEWTKPHPEAFGAAMKAVGVTDPASCVFVGDRPFDDVHGAQQAGMRAVLVPNSDVPEFAGVVPDAVIASLAELPGVLASW